MCLPPGEFQSTLDFDHIYGTIRENHDLQTHNEQSLRMYLPCLAFIRHMMQETKEFKLFALFLKTQNL
jgi:hypothetical protein